MANREKTPNEIAELAEAIYHRDIEPKLHPEDTGRLLVIDPDSGQYVLGDDETEVMHEAERRFPIENSYLMRVGYRAAHRFGASARLAEGR